ncbi:MAG TPA: hypothetical protein DD381_11195 [Lentisphaeria bacterium]|nr:MAG: hypothetical protein A2X47_00410 [Lentisphaerae bacterium GWF2_38_69]HBM16894.1 hypothetical protein [Lentisphaeria bacterium]
MAPLMLLNLNGTQMLNLNFQKPLPKRMMSAQIKLYIEKITKNFSFIKLFDAKKLTFVLDP